MANEIKASVTIETSGSARKLRELDAQVAERDRRIDRVVQRVRRVDGDIERAKAQMAKLSKQVFKGAARQGIALGLGEIADELDLKDTAIGRLGTDFVEGLVFGGPKAAVASVGIGLIRELARLIKSAKKEREDAEESLEKIREHTAKLFLDMEKKAEELKVKMNKEILEVRKKTSAEARDLFYKTAQYIGETR